MLPHPPLEPYQVATPKISMSESANADTRHSDLGVLYRYFESPSMKEAAILSLEKNIGVPLPEDYRDFLLSNDKTLIEPHLSFNQPFEGCVDFLLTIEDITKNDEENCIGIPDKGLMHIGGCLMGSYIYIALRDQDFGQIAYLYMYQEKFRFASFSDFALNVGLILI